MSGPWPSRVLVVAMVTLGATLSFSLEPIVGRLLTPSFGSAVHVWTTCVMVFQALLLFGYLYAHFVAPRLGPWHLAALLSTAAFLPLSIHAQSQAEAPIASIVWIMMIHVAVPFTALCTTAVVAQLWWSRSEAGRGGEPWWLYGASNVGSMIGLIGYPIVEPFVGVWAQTAGWTVLYAVWIAVVGGAWWVLRPTTGASSAYLAPPGAAELARWLALSALPSALLLAVTNEVANEIGSFPLVWVVPMVAYLGSFVLAFGGYVPRRLVSMWPEVTLLCGACWALKVYLPLLLVFGVLCVLVHAALYEIRPGVERLTSFYLALSLGGAVGGAVVTLAAPVWLDSLWELPLGLALMFAVMPFSGIEAPWTVIDTLDRPARLLRASLGGAAVALAGLSAVGLSMVPGPMFKDRSFYGTYAVKESTDGAITVRQLTHGRTVHGRAIAGLPASDPGCYYDRDAAIARSMRIHPRPWNAGIVGLGAGAMAGLVEDGDRMVFYEIDPLVDRVARDWFPFLAYAADRAEVRVGDARILLDQEPDQALYNVLVIDGFSGDGIPVHLVTREAIGLYKRRLTADGVLGLHISNRYYDLRGVVMATAEAEGFTCGTGRTVPDAANIFGCETQVVVCVQDAASVARMRAEGFSDLSAHAGVEPRIWTDDHQDLLPVMISTLMSPVPWPPAVNAPASP